MVKPWYKNRNYLAPGVIGALVLVSIALQHPGISTEATRIGPQEIIITEVPRQESKSLLIQTELPSTTETTKQLIERQNVPVETPAPVREESSCHPSYSGCLNPNASDYDCAGGLGNGPYYTGPVQVLGYDEFDLDRDNDDWGCE